MRILRVKGRKRILSHAGSAEKEAGTAAPDAEDSGADIYREKGDCLWNIAKSVYGSGTWCYELARKNNIKNPDLIYPGQVLEI